MKTVRLTEAAYERLNKQKLPGESFSEVILREIPNRCETCGEILDYFWGRAVPKADPEMRKVLLEGREVSRPVKSRSASADH
jgi:predicted CopG family antitoxin